MSRDIAVKICGITTPETLQAATDAGARYIGFNFVPKSPRYLTPDEAPDLMAQVPPGVCKVALVVNPDADALAYLASLPVDMIQLHGAETPDRLAEIKAQAGLPVMKAVGVAEAADLAQIDAFAAVADQILVDAKPPKGAAITGGHGLPFDWNLIAGRRWPVPWMLAGGLTAANVAEAIARTGARQIDLSSGVETAPGVKDPDLIRAFMAAATA